jgi:hypothetical protein
LKWVFEKLMHQPSSEELEALLPANWIKTRPAACQTNASRVAWMPEPPELRQKFERRSVNRLLRKKILYILSGIL